MKRVQVSSRYFFATPPAPCPYIDGRIERKVVTLLAGDDPDQLHNALSHAGFRRSQDLAYRPACDGCDACVPVRIRVRDFNPTKSQKRILRKNTDMRARECPALAREEHYNLFRRYLLDRHAGGGMADMGYTDYRAMVEETPVQTFLVEFRRPDGELYAVCLSDRMEDGLSLVYSFFDPDADDLSPGAYMIMWHIAEAQKLDLPYVYLGYWIADSRKMAYKSRFRPIEALGREGWTELDSV